MVNREIELEIESKSKLDAISTSQSKKSDHSIRLAAKGGGVIFAGSMVAYGIRMATGILLARMLGAEQFGLYTLALSTITLVAGLAELGLGPALVRYVSIFAGRRDNAGLWGTLQSAFGLSMLISLLIGIGMFVLATPIAEQIFNDDRLVPLLHLGSLTVLFLVLGDMLAAATQGFKKMQYTVIAQNITQPTIKLIMLIIVALLIGLNAANVLAVYTLALAIVVTLLLYFLHRLFNLWRPLNTAHRNTRQLLSFSLPVYGTRLIKTFGGNIQTFLLGALQAVTSVGVFAVADRVNMIGRMFHQSIVTTSAPIVSELYDQGKREQLNRYYQTVTKWTFTVNLPIFLILQLFPGVILSIFGKEFVGGALALTILAWGSLVDAGTGICGVVIDMTGKTGLKLVNIIIVTSILIGLNWLLIPRWGLIGAAVATATASSIVNILRLIEVYVLYRLLPYNPSFLKPVAASLVALASAWVVKQILPTETNLIYIVINMLIIMSVYAGLILLFGLSPEDRSILDAASKRLRTRFNKKPKPTISS